MKFVFSKECDNMIVVSEDGEFEYETENGSSVTGRFCQKQKSIELSIDSYFEKSDLIELRDLVDALIKVAK